MTKLTNRIYIYNFDALIKNYYETYHAFGDQTKYSSNVGEFIFGCLHH